jgi:hypothetical protein
MIASLLLLSGVLLSDTSDQPNVTVEKQIVYRKEETVDLSGSDVKGQKQLPPAFFVTKEKTPGSESLLARRLRFSLNHFNETGF